MVGHGRTWLKVIDPPARVDCKFFVSCQIAWHFASSSNHVSEASRYYIAIRCGAGIRTPANR